MTLAAETNLMSPLRGHGMRGLRFNQTGKGLSTADAARLIAKGTWPRVGFAIFVGVIGAAAMPFWFTAAWAAFMTAWELLLRPQLDRRVAIALSHRSEDAGILALAIINMLGGFAYAVFPFTAWHADNPLGVVFATAWICGGANHAFVYFSSHRPLLIAVLIPLGVCALAAPFFTTGASVTTVAAALTLILMIAAAGLFGRDRVFLLDIIAKQAVKRAEAERANSAKSQFLATMSHELRTPLNAIIGYAELIEEEPEDAKEDAIKIRTAARQLLSVINVILDLSRLEAGEVELKPERVAIPEILEQVRESAAPLAAANGNSFHMVAENDLDEAELDHARLYQCVMQLIANAAKFTSNGSIDLVASREQRGSTECVVFAVRDTGPGIAADQIERLFEPFVQGENAAGRRFGGAGLGLAFVRRVARLMGGDVSCMSELGRGSTFILWIPLRR